jgi:type VI secretion system FHA domain protein
MALRLRVLGPVAERLGDRVVRVFGVHGGHVGRSADCDWVLPDPERFLSGRHAAIEYRGGHWYVVDTSMNGVYVNGAPKPLGRDRAYALQDGDRLRMGEYEFAVTVTPDNDYAAQAEAVPHTYAQALDVPPQATDLLIATHGDIGADLDVTGLLASPIEPTGDYPKLPANDVYGQTVSPLPRREPPPPASHRAAPPPRVAPPAVVPPGMAAAFAPPPAAGTPPAPRGAEPNSTIAGLAPLQAFCRGAGIDAAKIPEQDSALVLALAGQLLREFALGVMLELQHRARQKHASQAARADAAPGAHNPFRTSRSVEEALQRLFSPRSQRYLPPVESVRAAFADLQKHEEATVGGLEAALADYLRRFAPDTLEEQFERSLSRVGGSTPAARARYWEMYAEMFRVLAQPGADGLPHAFAEEFAAAYARHEASSGRGKAE